MVLNQPKMPIYSFKASFCPASASKYFLVGTPRTLISHSWRARSRCSLCIVYHVHRVQGSSQYVRITDSSLCARFNKPKLPGSPGRALRCSVALREKEKATLSGRPPSESLETTPPGEKNNMGGGVVTKKKFASPFSYILLTIEAGSLPDWVSGGE